MERNRPEALGLSSRRLEQIGRIADDYIERGEVSGTVVAVVRDGSLAYVDARGSRNVELGLPMTEGTLFRIYSMTKPITTAAVMLLFERGGLRLTDPLSRFFPEFGEMGVYVSGTGASAANPTSPTEPSFKTVPAEREIRVWDLLTHTAGLAYGIGDEHPVEKAYERAVWAPLAQDPEMSLAEMAANIASLPLVHHPGHAWRYSIACDLLAAVVERVTGAAFADFLTHEILVPLGMTETWFTVPPSERERLAVVYEQTDAGLRPADDPPIMSFTRARRHANGGGGLVSTMHDYLRFAQMLLDEGRAGNDYLLSPRTVRMMMTNHLPPNVERWDRPGSGFGFGGQVVTDVTQLTEYGSAGRYSWGGAASTLFWVDPEERLAVVLLLQRVPGFSSRITDDLYTTVYQALVGR
ncbi:MAG: serine hydrolase domain-containing protein [Spirochaetota bacterium]